jgi:hypothetical protein
MIEDPVQYAPEIYDIGTYLSACANANLDCKKYFPSIARLSEGLYDWFCSIPESELLSNSAIISNFIQALPILLLNLAEPFKAHGEGVSAMKWIERAEAVSCRLGTLQFAFITRQQ